MKPSHPWLVVLLVLLLCACASRPSGERAAVAAAQPRATAAIAGFEILTFVTGGAKPGDPLPMIIGLHYSSATPETIVADFDQIEVPARIVLPRGRFPRPEGYSWFPSNYGELSIADQAPLAFQAKDQLINLIDAVTKSYPTVGKPALVGTSYGGDLSYLIALHHPDRVVAAFPVAARLPAEWIPATNTCRPTCPLVYAMYGDKDPIVPIDGGRRAAKQLVDMGFRVELHEYAGVGHDFTAQMKADFTANVTAALGLQPRS